MKIFMDFRKYDGVIGGVEQGAIQITRHLCARGHEVILGYKAHKQEQVAELFGELNEITLVPFQVRTHVVSLRNAWLDAVVIQNLAEKEGVDVIHFPYNWSFPFRKKAPCILTVHDVIPYTFREAMDLFRNRFVYRPSLRMACRLNDIIVTVSEFSKRDISEKVGVPLDKIRVVPNGLREPAPLNEAFDAALRKKLNVNGRFILNVGGIHKRKNIIRLIQAFSRLVNRRGYDGSLVITGSVSGAPYQDRMKVICDAAVREAGMEDKVIFSGFITERELDSLLRLADIMVYPSLYEGFGIPILEAMKVGTPAIASVVTAMPEVAGDAAILVDPYDVDQMTFEMFRLIQDTELREALREKGAQQAQAYSWERNFEQYFKLYQELAGKSG